MKKVHSKIKMLDSDNNIRLVQNAVKKNLSMSIPFLADIAYHMVAPHNKHTRTLVLLQSANWLKVNDRLN